MVSVVFSPMEKAHKEQQWITSDVGCCEKWLEPIPGVIG